jgi:hypothetical protein
VLPYLEELLLLAEPALEPILIDVEEAPFKALAAKDYFTL